jgi:HEXXH motif-containing protein
VVAAAAALRGGLALRVAVPTGGAPSLRLPGLGTVALPAATGPYAPAVLDWRPAPRVVATHRGHTLDVTLEPLDGTPPDRVPAAWWRDRLAAGWRILARHHPGVAAEVAAGIRVVTPLAAAPGVLQSATYRDAFGCVAMTAPPDPRWAALTFAHEVQHAKLSVFTDVVRLTRPGGGALFYAPWRDDPRPVASLLHGLYAHVGVTAFWRRQRRHEPTGEARLRAETEFARWHHACLLAAASLHRSGLLTGAGTRFVSALDRLLARWSADPVPAAAATAAYAEADDHRARWLAVH